MSDAEAPPIEGWDAAPPLDPPWATGPIPDVNSYLESEAFVAGAISTMEPFCHYHPAWALPIARQALDALGQWEPSDAAFDIAEPESAPESEWVCVSPGLLPCRGSEDQKGPRHGKCGPR